MKKFLLWLRLLIKSQLKSKIMIAFLLGMPAVCFICTKLPAMTCLLYTSDAADE